MYLTLAPRSFRERLFVEVQLHGVIAVAAELRKPCKGLKYLAKDRRFPPIPPAALEPTAERRTR